MQRPCVLLVEDDPAVRRFVQLALEPLSVELVSCATLAEAQQVLIASSPQLVLTDLTLPDGSGLDLLHWLHDRAQQPSGLCRTVVFSGGIDPTMERKLKALQVWRVLHKPASVGSLMACVADVLAAEVQAVESAAAVPQSDPVADFLVATVRSTTPTALPVWSSWSGIWTTGTGRSARVTCRPCGAWPTTSSQR